MGLLERIANDEDPLRIDLQTARTWLVHPTVFLRERTVEGPWTDQDTAYARALACFEAGLCPGCSHDLAETTKPENEDRYEWGRPKRCFRCVARDYAAKQYGDDDHAGSLLFSFYLPDEPEAS